MQAVSSFLWHLCSCFGVLLQLLRYALSFCWALLLPWGVTAAHVIVLNQAHLERLLKEFIENYYHPARPHQGLAGETPVPQAPPGEGELISVPVLGGLHHRYCRAAA